MVVSHRGWTDARRVAGLLLESFSCLSHLDPSILTSLSEVHTKVFNTALALVSWHLQSDDLNLQLLALRILTILAPDLWASKSEKDNDGGAWGEKTWKKIMGGLQSCDGVVRKQVSFDDVSLSRRRLSDSFDVLRLFDYSPASTTTSPNYTSLVSLRLWLRFPLHQILPHRNRQLLEIEFYLC